MKKGLTKGLFVLRIFTMFQIRKIPLILIRIYQKTLSLDHGILSKLIPGGACRFHPTCSQYCYQAIEKFGIIKGMKLGSKRILKCHPWNDGGYDPIPDK